MNRQTAAQTLRAQILQLAAAAAQTTLQDHLARQKTDLHRSRRDGVKRGSNPLEMFDQIANNLAAPALEALSVLAGEEFSGAGAFNVPAAKETDNVSDENLQHGRQETPEEARARIQRDTQAWDAAQREAQAAADRAKVEATRRETAARVEAELKAAARAAWKGTELEFELQWPTMRAQMLADKALADAAEAKRSFAATVQSFF